MSKTVDILAIDNKIRKKFATEYKNLTRYQNNLLEIKKSLESNDISNRLKKTLQEEYILLSDRIKKLENLEKNNFYIAESIHLIEEYKKILRIPIKRNFLGRPSKGNKNKKILIKKYLNIAKKYIEIDRKIFKSNMISCQNCKNKKSFDIIDRYTYICTKCFAQQKVMKHNSSYNDIDRVNIASKYMYDRKVHFRDCIKQYQGKQNCTIHPEVYEKLELEFQKHHLLLKDKGIKKFKNITKNHILMFLKELGYSNHYENVHLIHYVFTGKKPEDISDLEDKLLDDFDVLTDLYDKQFKHINRKNFINTQYVLYQLLLRHKHVCKKEEFIILKTIDRKLFHDEVCQKLFSILGWNSTPFY